MPSRSTRRRHRHAYMCTGQGETLDRASTLGFLFPKGARPTSRIFRFASSCRYDTYERKTTHAKKRKSNGVRSAFVQENDDMQSLTKRPAMLEHCVSPRKTANRNRKCCSACCHRLGLRQSVGILCMKLLHPGSSSIYGASQTPPAQSVVLFFLFSFIFLRRPYL